LNKIKKRTNQKLLVFDFTPTAPSQTPYGFRPLFRSMEFFEGQVQKELENPRSDSIIIE
jgi:hypothetical protein